MIEFVPMEPGEVEATMADVNELNAAVGFHPHTPIEVGVERFVEWYCSYYRIRD